MMALESESNESDDGRRESEFVVFLFLFLLRFWLLDKDGLVVWRLFSEDAE